MGYELKGERAKQKRKPPVARLNSPPIKHKYTRKVLQTDGSKGTECKKCDTYKQEIKRLQNEVYSW